MSLNVRFDQEIIIKKEPKQDLNKGTRDPELTCRKTKKGSIGIGLPIAEEPSLTTVRTDRVYGDSAVTDRDSPKAD